MTEELADVSFLLELAEEVPGSFCKASFLCGRVSSFQAFVMFTLMSRVSRSRPANASFAFLGTNLGFVLLPIKYFASCLKRLRDRSQILRKVSSDVFRLTGLLKSLF